MVERQLPKLHVQVVAKAAIYRNVDRKAWEQIVKKHQGTTVVVVTGSR